MSPPAPHSRPPSGPRSPGSALLPRAGERGEAREPPVSISPIEGPPGVLLLGAGVAVFGITAAVYLATMSRTVGFIDRGELAAVACTLGIAHPTGYPTFTLIGHLVCLLMPSNPILALNVLAALLVASGAAVLVPLFERAVVPAGARRAPASAPRSRPRPDGPRRAAWPLAPTQRAALAGLGALLVAFAPMWWQQANGYEVYALHALMLPLVLVLYLRWIEAEEVAGGRADERSVRRARGRGRLFAILLGLAFTNHMTTGLLGPALLTHAVVSLGPSRATMRRFLALAPWWALGLLPYAYLPLRASAHPAIAWGDVGTWRGFIAHLTAWQYRVWMFADPATFREQLNYFLAVVPDDLAYGGLVLAVAGAWWLARRRGRLALLAGLMLVATVLYSCNYGIRDIDPYFLPALIALGVAATAGLTALRDAAGTRTALAVGALLVAGSAVLHYRACDESGNTLAHDLAANVLETLPPHALMLSTQWDYTVSPACYLQAVSGLRPDVLILDAELLRRSWYVRALGRKDAGLARRARPALDRFLRVVAPFEHGQPFDSAVIQDAYIGMVDALIDEAGATRPVFVTAEVDRRFGARYRRVPYQLALWLRAGDEYLPQPFPHYRFRPWRGHVDEDAATVHRIYGQALATRMEYEAATGHPAEARAYGRYALSFDPGYRLDRLPPLALDSADLLRDRIEFFEQLPERVRSLTAAADTAVAR